MSQSIMSLVRSWFRRGRPRAVPAVLVLKTRTCPLCDDAAAWLEMEQKKSGFAMEIRDISNDAAALREFVYEVPVVFVDGVKRLFGKVDPVLFRREVAPR